MFGDRLPKGVDILPQAKRGGSVKLVCLRLGPFPRQFDDFFTNGIRHAASVCVHSNAYGCGLANL